MSTSIPIEPADSTDPVVTETPAPVPAPASAYPDPITGEPGAHPVGVGVGAFGAGAAGAAIGSIGGPIGVLIGAAIGAVAGGLAGKEVASTSDAPVEDGAASGVDESTGAVGAGMPGEDLRAMSGAGFSSEDEFRSTGTGGSVVEEDALPTPVHAATATDVAMPRNGEEAVRVAAYYHFLERQATGDPGDAVGDWLSAEREMMLS